MSRIPGRHKVAKSFSLSFDTVDRIADFANRKGFKSPSELVEKAVSEMIEREQRKEAKRLDAAGGSGISSSRRKELLG